MATAAIQERQSADPGAVRQQGGEFLVQGPRNWRIVVVVIVVHFGFFSQKCDAAAWHLLRGKRLKATCFDYPRSARSS